MKHTPTSLVTVGRQKTVRTPADKDAIIAAVERWRVERHAIFHYNWEYDKHRSSQTLCDDQLHPYHYARSANIFRRSSATDEVLQMATTQIRCG